MKLSNVSSSHSELRNEQGNVLVVFSYGIPVAIRVNSQVVVNADYFRYSKTTSKHVNASFPRLRTEKADLELSNADFVQFVSLNFGGEK